MRLTFKKIIIHGFLSYGHSEILLDEMGYCLVKGINKCPTDNALSNGAGKSSWINALCWALTGVTVQGNKSNLKNIFLEENSCYVTVFFNADGKEYEITRINNPKSDLKIIIDGEDKSGKGIEESKKILSSYLPDLTKDLIATTTILGQGLPDRFTNNTPAGRKEVLEKLSKSDFMIEDIKNRLTERSIQLAGELRQEEDTILAEQSKRPILENQLTQQKQLLVEKSAPKDFDGLIKQAQDQIQKQQKEIEELESKIKLEESTATTLSSNYTSLFNEKQKARDKVAKEHQEESKKITESLIFKTSEKSQLEKEIDRLSKVTDICPTCGQKIPNAVKPDLTPKKTLLEELNKSIQEIKDAQKEDEDAYQDVLVAIGEKFDILIKEAKDKSDAQTSIVKDLYLKLSGFKTTLREAQLQESNLKTEKANYESTIKTINDKIAELEKSIAESTSVENKASTKRINLKGHQEVINKMTSFVKRDFRGFLLQNVIAFIDEKCKEYAKDVFGTQDLEFKLDGNNIDILYSQKDLESLSGGEQQRVNIIIQLAIRDMMCKFLNFSSNIIILDELFDQLDSLSTSKVIDLITNQLKDLDSVFIISHHADELEIPYDSNLVIEKNSQGISTVL